VINAFRMDEQPLMGGGLLVGFRLAEDVEALEVIRVFGVPLMVSSNGPEPWPSTSISSPNQRVSFAPEPS